MFSRRAVVSLVLWSICIDTVSGGEIIIAPVAKSKTTAPVANDPAASGELEEGVLSPRSDDAPAGSRLENQGYYRGTTRGARPLGKEAASGSEIIITPVVKSKTVTPATSDPANDKKRSEELTSLRNKAQAYKSGGMQSVPSSGAPIVIHMDASGEIEEGILLPRSDDSPAGNRLENQGYYRGSLPATHGARPLTKEALPADTQHSVDLLEKNRSKAQLYMQGKPAPSKVSPNDEMAVACDSTGSVAGRIGDDSMSGREIVVIRNNKQVKMRCK